MFVWSNDGGIQNRRHLSPELVVAAVMYSAKCLTVVAFVFVDAAGVVVRYVTVIVVVAAAAVAAVVAEEL